MADAPLLRVDGVSKAFVSRTFSNWLGVRPARHVVALEDVSFGVEPGHIVALLGPNGAGKTTLISIICDLVRADRGEAHVGGLAVSARGRETRRRIGLVTTNERSFFWRLTGRQNLHFFGSLYDLPRREIRRRTDLLFDRFGMTAHADRLFRTYSAGMKKRLGLARALLHDPPVLLMDEPTTSLDAAGSEDLLDLVRTKVAAQGKCVVWATHLLEEVTQLCNSVVVLVAARVRFRGSISDFTRLCNADAGSCIDVTVPGNRHEEVARFTASIGGRLDAADAGTRIVLPSVAEPGQISDVLRRLLDMGVTVRRVDAGPSSLSRLFTDLAGAPAPGSQQREPGHEP